MSDDYAKPGDTIEVTNSILDKWVGRIFVVIAPDRYDMSPPGSAWVLSDGTAISAGYFTFDCYKIIARGNGFTLTSSEIDRSLDKQRDDNLRGVFT